MRRIPGLRADLITAILYRDPAKNDQLVNPRAKYARVYASAMLYKTLTHFQVGPEAPSAEVVDD